MRRPKGTSFGLFLPKAYRFVCLFVLGDSSIHYLCFSLLMFSGGSAPVDGITYRQKYVTLTQTSSIVTFTFTSIGILLALAFFVINIVYKNER